MTSPIESCVFCAIATGVSREQVFYENEHVVAFLDIAPAARGHALVVPTEHAADILAITADGFAAVARAVHAVAALLDEELQPDGLTIMQSNRAAAWQDVDHLHVHVIPRFTDDALVPPWSNSPSDAAADLPGLTNALRNRTSTR